MIEGDYFFIIIVKHGAIKVIWIIWLFINSFIEKILLKFVFVEIFIVLSLSCIFQLILYIPVNELIISRVSFIYADKTFFLIESPPWRYFVKCSGREDILDLSLLYRYWRLNCLRSSRSAEYAPKLLSVNFP